MCGILGGNNIHWNYEKGINVMAYRGPNGMKVSKYKNFVLAFARLAIMDLSERAMQPMDSDDKLVHIVFNGEIYGFSKLKEKLQKKYYFRTTSDTEVILKEYLEYGDSFVEHIDGMFSIVIYDEREQKVKLFRDRAGIKPLYYFYDGENFAFSSELKGIEAACDNINFKVDYTAIYDFLYYQYIPEPKSMYKYVYKLPPATKLVFDVNKKKIVEQCRYWKLHVNTSVGRKHSAQEIHEHLKWLIQKSVKDQMVADVPVGTFLSGGVDSSVITYESSRLNHQIQAFAIGFEDRKYDELGFAKLLAEKYGLSLKTKVIGKMELSNTKGMMAKWYDEPFADTSAYPTYQVCKLAKEEVTVVLTGDGGDELFGGYDRYKLFLEQKDNIRNHHPKLFRLLVKLVNDYGIINDELLEMFQTEIDLYGKLLGFNYTGEVTDFAKRWKIDKDYEPKWYLYQYYNMDLPPLTRMRYLDFKTYLPSDILTKVDRVSMQLSLEARVPFLSKDIIEFIFSLSEEECFEMREFKGCLKYAYKDIIPNDILFRPKSGFVVPPNYLRNEWKKGNVYAGVLRNEWPNMV